MPDMLSPDQIRENLVAVERRIAAACDRAGRRREEVTLVAVSKTFPAEAVQAVIEAGATDVGENRVQEAREKRPAVHGDARWHLIGHLQSNKAKDAVRLFDLIQTVDTVDPKPFDRRRVVGAVTWALGELSAHAQESGVS